MKQSFLKVLLVLTVLFSISSTSYSQKEQSKEIDLSTFSSWGLQYAADFEYIDKGIYGFVGHNFGLYKGFGISFSINSNIGIVDSDVSTFMAKIGPNYSYAFSEKVCFYVPFSLDLMWASSPTYKHVEGSGFFGDYSFDKKEVKREFHWGLEITPSFGFKVGKTTLSAGLMLNWGEGSSEISTGAIIGVGFPI